MSKNKPSIQIQNIVASVSLNQKIDLQEIVEKFPQTEYNPSVFPGLVDPYWPIFHRGVFTWLCLPFIPGSCTKYSVCAQSLHEESIRGVYLHRKRYESATREHHLCSQGIWKRMAHWEWSSSCSLRYFITSVHLPLIGTLRALTSNSIKSRISKSPPVPFEWTSVKWSLQFAVWSLQLWFLKL